MTPIQALVEEARKAYPGVLRTTLLGQPGHVLWNGSMREDVIDIDQKNFDCRNLNLSVIGSEPKDGVYLVQWKESK